MRTHSAKWILPGLLTIVAGTAAGLFLTVPGIEDGLAARASTLAQRPGISGATVTANARDLVLTGTATQPGQLEKLIADIAALHGVRNVRNRIEVAAIADPYTLTINVTGTGLALSGAMPDNQLLDRLQLPSGTDISAVALRAGVPTRPGWDNGVAFAVRQAARLQQGSVELQDMVLNITGLAANRTAFDGLAVTLAAATPEGIELGTVNVAPPVQSPYAFTARYDGRTVDLSGYSPDKATTERLVAAAPADAKARLVLASGAPDGFAERANAGLNMFGLMANGTLTLDGDQFTLSGAAATPAAMTELQPAAEKAGIRIAQIDPPTVAPYTWQASKSANGSILIEGHVPDSATRTTIAGAAGPQALESTQIALGAPDGFAASAVAGLSVLIRLESGNLSLDGEGWHVSGTALDSESGLQAQRIVEDEDLAGQGWEIDLTIPEPVIPVADPYTWSAVRAADGSTVIDGYVPAKSLQSFQNIRATDVAADRTELAQGAPDDFALSVMNGLDALNALESGELQLDAQGWSLTGTAASAEARDSVRGNLEAALDTSDWQIAITVPEPVETPVDVPELDMQLPAEAPAIEVPASETTVTVPELDMQVPEEAPQIDVQEVTEPPVELPEPDMKLPDEAPQVEAPEAEPVEDATLAVPELDMAVPAEAPQVDISDLAAPEAPAFDPAYAFVATKPEGAEITLSGFVPAEATANYLTVLAGEGATNNLTVAEGAPEGFVPTAVQGMRALAQMRGGTLSYSVGDWRLSGTAPNEAARSDLLASLPAEAWETDIDAPAPIEVCRAEVAGLFGDRTILFNSGSDHIAAQSAADIEQLAVYLDHCPDAYVYVEGHTDSDGDEDSNLALSLARAEAVTDRLREFGVDPSRLYAVGYGESLPIAPNDTRAGKQRNRRIVITISNEGL